MDRDQRVYSTKEAVKEFQCCGCVGDGLTCYGKRDIGIGCKNHVPGTVVGGQGRILLGLPRGFNRTGQQELIPYIFQTQEDQEEEFSYDKFNIPIWKYSDGKVVIVRGYQPRLNQGFIHIILGGDIGKIDALELKDSDLEEMD